MTLRLRLAIALVALVTVGLAVFGYTTYTLYSRSQYNRLDDSLRGSVSYVGANIAGSTEGRGDHDGGPPRSGPLEVFGEIRDSSGQVVGTPVHYTNSTDVPAIPDHVTEGQFFDSGSENGSTRWRVYVADDDDPHSAGRVVIVAAPLTDVTNSLHRLVLIELSAALGLLLVIGVGSWMILRRGLHPLEHMAITAGEITAGDLTQRVDVPEHGSEVAELGVAFNTMLDEIEEAFAERDATEQRLRQFLADASHELRTPLTSIQGFAELFRVGGDDRRVDLPVILRRIEEETARMRVLVDDLLLLAQLDQVRAVEANPVDLAVLAADACTDAVAAAPGRPITLDAPEPVMVSGQRNHLRQAINNLVANAVKHTADGTPIDVGATVAGRSAVVTVRDYGPGLDDDALEHAFDRFWQADPARVGHGAGLGLSIVAAIAAEHGGTASAANASDGRGGAVFTLTLPVT